MTSKLAYKKIPKKIFKSCFKFVFLTKKFKEIFLNATIRNIKIHNILDTIESSKFMDLINLIIKKTMKMFLKCFLWLFKVWWSKKIKVWRS
jgi:hypothetical protein